VALIKGKNPDKATVALRADIDALPIQESKERHAASPRHAVDPIRIAAHIIVAL